jgi:hypothetical protein
MMATIYDRVNALFVWLRTFTCVWHGRGFAGRCVTDIPYASSAAISVFAFGIWMVVLGGAFIIYPSVSSSPNIQKMAAFFGFPKVAGLWSRLFGAAIGSFGLFYFAGALFELRSFFWMTVFGRMGVFGVCTYLAWRHPQEVEPSGPKPHNLLPLAAPDLVCASLTAWLLLGDYLAGVVFLCAMALLTAALGFLTFPGWIMKLVGVEAKPDTWNIILGAVMAFFAAYGMGAALFDYGPILWSAILANIILLLVLLFGLLLDPIAKQSSVRLKWAVAALLVVAVGTVTWAFVYEEPSPAAETASATASK